MPLTPNTTILNGKCTIIRQLGKGAFAYVWLAGDHAMGQQVAIKELCCAELPRDEFSPYGLLKANGFRVVLVAPG